MEYNCDTCGRTYKYKRNLVRHIKERHNIREYWRCTTKGCHSKFIRRSYLCKHLVFNHGMDVSSARAAALSARLGNPEPNSQYYEDVSDDDSILDLLNERDCSDNEMFQETMNYFDFDKFDDVKRIDVNNIDINNNEINNEDSKINIGDDEINIGDGEINSECERETNNDFNNNDKHHDNNQRGIPGCGYSDISDCEVNDDSYVEDLSVISVRSEEEPGSELILSNAQTITQTLVLRFTRTITYTNDNIQ